MQVELVEYDHLIKVKKVEEEMVLEDIVNVNSKFVTLAIAEPALKSLSEGQCLQFERRGFYRIDKIRKEGETIIYTLIFIPDGKTKGLASIATKVILIHHDRSIKPQCQRVSRRSRVSRSQRNRRRRKQTRPKSHKPKSKHPKRRNDIHPKISYIVKNKVSLTYDEFSALQSSQTILELHLLHLLQVHSHDGMLHNAHPQQLSIHLLLPLQRLHHQRIQTIYSCEMVYIVFNSASLRPSLSSWLALSCNCSYRLYLECVYVNCR